MNQRRDVSGIESKLQTLAEGIRERAQHRRQQRLAEDGCNGGASAGTAIAAVLGQSLLSPVLGTLTDAFSQRLQFALYPTYVSPLVQSESERISGQVPPQLALVTDIGVSMTDRFDFSVLAAPNRNDIPSQGTLTYQINSTLGASVSMDTQGTWQSQLQLFFRF